MRILSITSLLSTLYFGGRGGRFIITVENGSGVEFKIIDYPQIIKPSYLGVTAYKETGEAIQIIKNEEFNKIKSNDTNKIDMKEGEYTLIATATWDGESEDVEGFQLMRSKSI